MNTGVLIANLLIAVIIILILILKAKQNPVIAMFVGALYMGIFSGAGLTGTVDAIVAGFGNTMTGIGISVGFGIILGQIVADTGAVQSIANSVIKVFGEKKADTAMGATGFIVSIPVFYDVGYVILVPIAKMLAKTTKREIAAFIGGLVAGLGIAHSFIPPTPGPLTGAELLGIDVGQVILFGLILGIPTFLLTILVYKHVFLKRKNFFNEACFDKSYIESEESENVPPQKLPGFFRSMLPIIVPIVLIVLGTASSAIMGAENVPEWIVFISNKNVAMFIGVLTAFFLAKGILNLEQLSKSVDKSLASAGMVLLITGMGGGLGNVLTVVGAGDAILGIIQNFNIPPLVFIWLISGLLRMAQGSGTVAMITSIGLVVPMLPQLDVSPVLMAMASFSGSLLCAHVNDSGFWVSAKIAGLSTVGGLKTYTLICFLESVISFAFILLLNLFM